MKTSAMAWALASALIASPLAAAAPPILFAQPWIDGTAANEPETQVQRLDADTFVIRQSIKTNFEGPFLYLVFGKERALLIDSGAGGLKIRPTIDRLIEEWLAAHHRTSVSLTVAHSHSHGDHIAGDAEFANRPDTIVVGHSPEEVARAFGIADWPKSIGTFDLGGRTLSIIPTPGHQIAHIMVYDPKLKLLFSGDALYPGRLYVPVNHIEEERASVDRLAAFAAAHPIRAALGAHIEMTDVPGKDYAQRAPSHPHEHRLELSPDSITELQTGLKAPLTTPGERQIHNDFIIAPVPPRDK
ncbi:glyoxylase-like metal-dependent hydrolase (beta-lactamase superfamily II) [Sphingomonas vulcanisoli]|uniref:Glyoxylase-like metal-dependent hydrolase (Beta-lactamase superfamily II) n=1 Tax=Sphingomonas vulcanisoli TaxID=1658060 RepID=A0ABX0TVG8_9SPHN|nr:MBL fold metallo-hydrolase [Sphingomonas vulcanisoli]NIJ08355.1 glyoxylase-like metal-dependent hydrolase (beta-lactamase superfamily II) [Sphingomonas vulcanisoli]